MKRWINESVDISDFADKLPRSVFELFEEAEEAERKGEEFAYYEICDNIDIAGKLLATEGVITDEEWDRLCEKYSPYIEIEE